MKINEKKEWAKLLFLRENLTQKEIATRIGVTEKTISLWVKKESWDRLKASIIISRGEQLHMIFMQIAELNDKIMRRDEGERFADTREADTLNKLAATARALELETSISDLVNAGIKFAEWLRAIDIDKAKDFSNHYDRFLKEVMQ